MLPAAFVLVPALLVSGVLSVVRVRWFRAAGAGDRDTRSRVIAALRHETAPDDPALDPLVIAVLDRQRAARVPSMLFVAVMALLGVASSLFAVWSGEWIGAVGLGFWSVLSIGIPVQGRRERRRNERRRAAIAARASAD